MTIEPTRRSAAPSARSGVPPARRAAVEAGQEILADRYSGAAAAIVAGSRLRGAGGAFSDIDLVVVFDALPHAHREAFLWRGIPVEAFVNDPGTLRWFLAADVEGGRPAMIDMVAEGEPVGPRPAILLPLRQEARALRVAGPPPLGDAALRILRYRITDLIDDLRAPRPAEELLAVGCALYGLAAEFMLRGRGRWAAAGKWIPREIARLDLSLAARFDGAFRALFAGNAAPAVALMEVELDRHGDPLFDGERRDAPAEWRRDDARQTSSISPHSEVDHDGLQDQPPAPDGEAASEQDVYEK